MRHGDGATGPRALEPWALELLRSGRVGRLGTAGADGWPLVVPVCFALIEGADTLQVVTAVDAKPKAGGPLRRIRNLEQNPQASLLVDVWDEDWTRLCWVMVEGRAAVLRQEDPLEPRATALRALEAKYPQYRMLPLDPRTTPVIVVRADRVQTWRFASVPSAP